MSQARYIADFVIQSNNIADGAVTFADVGALYTSNVTENTSLYFTNARATAAVVAGAAANSILFVSSAGVLANSNTLVWTGSNLGIGTGTPTTRLDVVNASGRAARIGGFQFGGTTTSADGGNNLLSSGVYWNGTNLTATQTTGAVLQLANGALQFQALSGLTAGNTYSYAPQMALDSSGNLGIGTGSPSARLHINGTSDATQRIIVNGTGNFSSYKLNYNGSEVAFIQNYQNTELNFGTTVNAPILFYVNNAEQMRLTSTGLGIGTTSPGAKLTVDITRTTSGAYDGILVTGTQTNNIGGGNNYALTVAASFANSSSADRLAQIYVKNPSLSGAAVVHSVRGISIDKISGGNQGSAQIYLANNTSGGAFNSISGQYALYSDNTADSYIAGNVGIGTTSPSTLLHVNGATTLGGTVNLSGVKIRDTSGTAKVYYNVTPGYDYYSSGSTAGAIVIDTNIPALTAGTMFNIKIAGYSYNHSAPYEVNLGVYCGENNIYSRGYSGTSIPFTSIRYARKTATGMLSIILGAVGDIVPISIVVERVIQNFSNLTLAQIDGWTISRITSTAAYDNINTVTGGSTGVPFLPTQFASSDPNVLDDYEEGSWTPDWRINGSPTGSWITKTGRYTKVGNMVTIWAYFFTVGGRGSGTGQVSITGLPFISKNTDLTNYHVMDARAGVSWSSGGAGLPFLYQPANDSRLIAYQTSNSTSSTTQQMSESNFSASGFIELNIMMTYETN